MLLHKYTANTKYSGIITTAQKIGKIENTTIAIFVNKETFVSSSHLFLRKVVKRHAKEAKLNTEIRGVANGNTKIRRRKRALIPKKSFNLKGITPTTLSVESMVSANLLANKSKKNSHDTLKIKGQMNLIIHASNTGSFENHTLKSTTL